MGATLLLYCPRGDAKELGDLLRDEDFAVLGHDSKVRPELPRPTRDWPGGEGTAHRNRLFRAQDVAQ